MSGRTCSGTSTSKTCGGASTITLLSARATWTFRPSCRLCARSDIPAGFSPSGAATATTPSRPLVTRWRFCGHSPCDLVNDLRTVKIRDSVDQSRGNHVDRQKPSPQEYAATGPQRPDAWRAHQDDADGGTL